MGQNKSEAFAPPKHIVSAATIVLNDNNELLLIICNQVMLTNDLKTCQLPMIKKRLSWLPIQFFFFQ